ncbi:hypothetical protein Acy02nite_02070 [Actinoplanes cyaneus]|uniref:Lipoprotein n=2 Tax=Actinoplanes cyaneus TaxID=52696 RepID=A0A919IBQ0_9ACTN|nr:hypothetical protein Acy02nite_02070 [Actinoplanes cyaneus]
MALPMAGMLALLSGCSGDRAEDASDALGKAGSFRYDIQVDVKTRQLAGPYTSATYQGSGTGLPQRHQLDLTFSEPGAGPRHVITDGETQYVQVNDKWAKERRPSFGRSLFATSPTATFDGALFDPASYLPRIGSDKQFFNTVGDAFVYTCFMDSSVNASCDNMGLDLGMIQDRSTIGQADLRLTLDGDGRPTGIEAEITYGDGSTFGGTVTTKATLRDFDDPITIQLPALS